MRITIAALACLLLLGAARGVYPELRQVLLYPSSFVVERAEPGTGGWCTKARACWPARAGHKARCCWPGTKCCAMPHKRATATTS